MTTHKIIVSGFGGQGIMGIGQLLAYAGMFDNKHVSWLPSYGPEMRGGVANCSVIISDEPIGAPNISVATEVIVMNNPSLDKFQYYLEKDGTIFVNSSIVTKEAERSDINVLKVPASDLALEFGNPIVMNMITIGAFNKACQVVSDESLVKAIEKLYGKKGEDVIATNKKALDFGASKVEAGGQCEGCSGAKSEPANYSEEVKAIRQAMLNEIEGAEFYKLSAEKFGNSSTRDILLGLAKEEELHYEYLKELAAKLMGTEEKFEADDLLKDVPSPEIYNWDKADPSLVSLAVSVFSVAMNMEKDSVAFYTEQRDKARSEEARKLFDILIKWEQVHLDQFTKQYKIYQQEWWDSQNFAPF